jgi:recombination protein RecT
MGNEIAKKVSNDIVNSFSNEKTQEILKSYFNNNPQSVIKFVSSMRLCFRANPKLAGCSKDSLIDVFMKCAEWGLFPSNTTGECYVIPYGKEAQFQLGYQGMVTLAYRSGIKRICAEVIYENDKFNYSFGLNPMLDHVPSIFEDRGEPKGAYAVAILDNGESIFKIMSKQDIFAFREKSQGYQRDVKNKTKYSPWQEQNDPQLNMWKKTCVRQLFKMLPKSQEMKAAFDESEKSDIIDIESERECMRQSDIGDFYNRLNKVEGYSKELINEGIKAVLKRDTFGDLTTDEAEILEAWLRAKTNEALDQKAAGGEEQGDLL